VLDRHVDLLFARTLAPSRGIRRDTYEAAAGLIGILLLVVLLSLFARKAPAAAGKLASKSSPVSSVNALTPVAPRRADAPPDEPTQSYALIPTGVGSAQDVRAAMANDDALREHYAGFHLEHAVMRVLVHDENAYVSYRKNQNAQIFWTKHPVLLHQGEFVLDDGTLMVRARCGNRIATFPQISTAPPVIFAKLQPPEMFLVPPPEVPIEAGPPPVLPLQTPPPPTIVPPLPPVVPIFYIPPGPGGGGGGSHLPPPVNTPEPPTIEMAAMAIACLVFLKFRRSGTAANSHNRS
jgi:hypothetical protein